MTQMYQMNDTLDTIKMKLEQLYDILLEISPLSEDIFLNPYSSELIDTLSSLIEKASQEKLAIQKENEETRRLIVKYSEELEMDIPRMERMENMHLEREMLRNELGRIKVMKDSAEQEIERLRKEIYQLKKDLNIIETSENLVNEPREKHVNEPRENLANNIRENLANEMSVYPIDYKLKPQPADDQIIDNQNRENNDILINNINTDNNSTDDTTSKIIGDCLTLPKIKIQLTSEKQQLINEIEKLESKREFFYQEIFSLRNKLYNVYEIPIRDDYSDRVIKVEPFPDFTYEEKILDLKRLLDETILEYNNRRMVFDALQTEIRKKESILGIEHKQFDYLYLETIEAMKNYEDHLTREQQRLFNTIFDRTMAQLSDIRIVLGKKVTSYPMTEEGLMAMRNELERLLPMRDIYIEIKEKIQKRKNLLEKMTEFEKIASDPRRLFKSSFQLNSEEKFRNNAYPSLLKLEESILEAIDKFEKSYGPFEYDGEEYKAAFKYEIENRIINKTIFISRCDSPFRKKK